MFGAAAAYVVAIGAMLLSALTALTLITAVKHFDPLETPAKPEPIPSAESAAV